MGGGISATLATISPGLRAAVVFDGQNPPLERVPNIRARILGIYGGEDLRITNAVPEFAAAMKEAGKSLEYHVYPDAPHAFFTDTKPNHRTEVARDAWRRVLAFFDETLRTI